MRVPLLDLKAQYSKLKPAIDEAALRVLASGRHVMGPELEAYEKELAAYLDLPHAVTVASGTDALLSAAMALGIVVLLFFTTVNASTPVWVIGKAFGAAWGVEIGTHVVE